LLLQATVALPLCSYQQLRNADEVLERIEELEAREREREEK
jgi:tRNA A-37 threonylcarbamoyl transferase component Bud32